ncbi:MAG TPA: cytochrome c [Stellaceae bacterium]|jgi:cytochrome c553|nr:cytochrome c [Stellaceae bacterium]
MFRKILPLALLVVAVLAPVSGRTEPLITLKSVTVDLTDSGRMFPGPGSDAINNNCLACHSAGMVLNQPALPKSAWQAEVTKMINIYKAPVSQEDAAAIVDYLTRTKGTE